MSKSIDLEEERRMNEVCERVSRTSATHGHERLQEGSRNTKFINENLITTKERMTELDEKVALAERVSSSAGPSQLVIWKLGPLQLLGKYLYFGQLCLMLSVWLLELNWLTLYE